MPTMLAARLHEIGKPMQLEQVPIPTPRPTDVVVQVKACNVVPNLKNVLATYAEWFPYLPLPQLPAIFGLDSAGVVTQVGDQVTRHPGRRPRLRQPRPVLRILPGLPPRRGPELPRLHLHGLLRVRPGRSEALRRLPLRRPRRVPDRARSGTWSGCPTPSPSSRAPASATSAPAFSALRKAGAGPGRTVLIDGISGTLGLGACLIALGLGVTRILGTGRNPDLLDDVKAIAPDRIDVLPAGTAHLPRLGPGADRRRGRRHRHRRRRTRRAGRGHARGHRLPRPRRGRWSTSAA